MSVFLSPGYHVNFGIDVQEGVAIEIAEAVVGALKGELAATAVNAPMVPAEVYFFFPDFETCHKTLLCLILVNCMVLGLVTIEFDKCNCTLNMEGY